MNFAEGATIRDSDTGAIYTIENGQKRWYPDWPTYVSWGKPAYKDYPNIAVYFTPQGPNFPLRTLYCYYA
jgi:hypothetical protein